MSGILRDLSTPALNTAIEANLFDDFRLFGHWSQAKCMMAQTCCGQSTDIPDALFNGVLHACLAPDQVDAAAASSLTHP
jgi:hypothetical protein